MNVSKSAIRSLRKNQIINIIKKLGGKASTREIVREAILGVSTVYSYLREMEMEGKVKRLNKHGRLYEWGLVGEG